MQLNDVYANNSIGDEILLDASGVNLTIMSSPVGIEAVNSNPQLVFNISPNPVQDNTSVDFYLNEKSTISIEITNTNGESIACLTNKELAMGVHKIDLDEQVKLLSAGIYFVKFTCNDLTTCKRIIKIK